MNLPPIAVTLIREWISQEMSEISEDHYAAGWMNDLPHSLWRAIASLPCEYRYGMGTISLSRLELLRDAANLIGEWNNGDKLISLSDWANEYDEKKACGEVITGEEDDEQ